MTRVPAAQMRHLNRPFLYTLYGSMVAALMQGAGLLFGPHQWTTVPSYEVLHNLLPFSAWGVVFLVVFALFLYGVTVDWRVVQVAGIIGLVTVTIWCGSFAYAAWTHRLTGIPGPWFAWAFVLYVQTIGPNGGFRWMIAQSERN